MLEDLRDYRLHPELPVFAIEGWWRSLVYVPGHVISVSADQVRDLKALWEGEAVPVTGVVSLATQLEHLASAVVQRWGEHCRSTYLPECLNIQLGYRCNLSCRYCFARAQDPGWHDAAGGSSTAADFVALAAAAELVASCCTRANQPFRLVVQGLGEPTQCLDELQRCVTLTREAARRHGLDWIGHITTNGQIIRDTAAWLAETFQSITLSCDGPPMVQDFLRPRQDGDSSSSWLQAAAQTMTRQGADVDVRATITPHNIFHMAKLVRYTVHTLGLRRLRIEPVFQQRAGGFPPDRARGFVYEYLLAEQEARRRGVDLSLSSPRLTELHDGHCDVLRNSLRVLPDGRAVNCVCGEASDNGRAGVIGRFDPLMRTFHLDGGVIERLRAVALEPPPECRGCLNVFHCARSCPEVCPGVEGGPRGSFRCDVQRLLAVQWIWQAADSQQVAGTEASASTTPADDEFQALSSLLQQLPDGVDRGAIEEQSRQAVSRYRLDSYEMPAPPWASRGFDVVGLPTRDLLRDQAALGMSPRLSIYIHIPFCLQKCVFCDCHSFPLRSRLRDREAAYVKALRDDMRFWAEETTAGSRPVTTVHFGGGTPNALDEGCLAAIVCECRDRFAVMEATEWAIETTAGLLTDSELFRLQKLGFSRLHVGVQTLDERLRRRLGRQTPVATVIERLRRAKAAGFVTSVDVIYGLPEQDACSLLNTLGALIASGIHGVSLYRLNLSQKNLRILKAFPGFRPSPLCDYLLLQCAEQRLIAAGYSKNHFVHYALPPDDDLYFRHAFRGEDLIGLGASASGNIGRLEYRCVEYPSYLAESWGRPAIEGTVLASPRTEALASLHATMMCGQPDRALAYAMHCDDLFDEWLSCGLVRPLSAESHVLTAVGSWLLSKMLREVMVHSEC